MFQRILVPFDFSEAALRALQEAARLAAEAGVGLTVMHVFRLPDVAEWLNPQLVDQAREAHRKEVTRRLTEQTAKVLPAEMPCQIELISGNPAPQIINEVTRGGYDLVVMGTHGRTGLDWVMLGSVTQRVLRRCPVPVLVIH